MLIQFRPAAPGQGQPHQLQAGRRTTLLLVPVLLGLSLFAIHSLETSLIANLNVYGPASALERAAGLIVGLELVWWLGLSWLGYSFIHLLGKRGQA